MSLSRLLTHQSELAAAPDRMTEGWLRGVADNILEEIWERTGEGPVFSERQRIYEMAYDREMDTVDYIRANYDRGDRLAIVGIDRRNNGRVQQMILTAEEIASPEFQRRLRAMNANGVDILIGQNSLKQDAIGRTKADIDAIRHVYLDVDVNGKEAVEKILAAESVPNPHHVIESSPGRYQLVWSVSGFSQAQAEGVMRGMAAQYGGDPAATDSARVLRLPGFKNHKYPELNHYVSERGAAGAAEYKVYVPSDFPTFSEAQIREYRTANVNVSAGTGTKSHADFAYAMQQLERGISAERIRSELEARRQDKPNPAYYAQRTVDNAVTKHAQNRQVKHQESQYYGLGVG